MKAPQVGHGTSSSVLTAGTRMAFTLWPVAVSYHLGATAVPWSPVRSCSLDLTFRANWSCGDIDAKG
jgi:hypothetical protein